MNSGIIFVKKDEADLACGELLGKTLLERPIDELKKAGIEEICLVGDSDLEVEGVRKASSVEAIGDLPEGKVLLTTPFYPLINKDDYEKVLAVEDGGAGVCFHVFVYNVQPGIVLDYLTGISHAARDNF